MAIKKQHLVICTECGQQFDLNKVQAVKKNRTRYAHQSCYPQGELVPMGDRIEITAQDSGISVLEKLQKGENSDFKQLTDYIQILFGDDRWPMIMKQVKTFKEKYNYTYTGMLKCLIYAYEIKKEDISKANGVGIIGIYYQRAKEYYYDLWLRQQSNVGKTIPIAKDIEIVIPPPKKEKKQSDFFKFLDEENE